jgi:hypothetical protein
VASLCVELLEPVVSLLHELLALALLVLLRRLLLALTHLLELLQFLLVLALAVHLLFLRLVFAIPLSFASKPLVSSSLLGDKLLESIQFHLQRGILWNGYCSISQ